MQNTIDANMQYIIIPVGAGNVPSEDFLNQLGAMGGRTITSETPQLDAKGAQTITEEAPQQQQTQNGSNWTGTLFKAALIGTAIAGAAYIGYRQGFFDAAIEVAKKAYDQGFSDGATRAVEEAAKECTLDETTISEIHSAVNNSRDALKEVAVPEVVEAVAKDNPLINPRVEGLIPNLNVITSIKEEWERFKVNATTTASWYVQAAFFTYLTIKLSPNLRV